MIKIQTKTSANMRLILFGFLLLITGATHAEGGCPTGMIPASGTNINSCIPIPPGYYNNQQQAHPQPPPPRWLSQWGAIATDGPGGSFGAAVDMPNQSSAENAALIECQSKKGSICKVELWYTNQCAAMVVGDAGHNSKAGTTVNAAIRTAMKICTTEDHNCFVYYSGCSLPIRIQ